MPIVYLTRRAYFNAAHKLYNTSWSQQENETRFGKCANEYWHGHNYHLFVTVKGTPNPDTGFFINATELKAIVQRVIIDRVDHKNLNMEVPFLQGLMPTTENFAIAIWNELKPHLEAVGCILHCIKLRETENLYTEYYGE